MRYLESMSVLWWWVPWLALARAATCPTDLAITDGIVTYDNLLALDAVEGSTAAAHCDLGFESGGADITCTAAGLWDGELGCVPSSCPLALTTVNGDFAYEGLVGGYTDGRIIAPPGAVAKVLCDTNHLSDIDTLTCTVLASWDNPIPACQPVCPKDILLAGGEMIYPTGPALVGSIASVQCTAGRIATVENVTCLASQNWDVFPKCERALFVQARREDCFNRGSIFADHYCWQPYLLAAYFLTMSSILVVVLGTVGCFCWQTLSRFYYSEATYPRSKKKKKKRV